VYEILFEEDRPKIDEAGNKQVPAPKLESGPAPPADTAIDQLAARAYRLIAPAELINLPALRADDDLCEALTNVTRGAGIAPEMDYGFVVGMIGPMARGPRLLADDQGSEK
jgi:hypothetical protein